MDRELLIDIKGLLEYQRDLGLTEVPTDMIAARKPAKKNAARNENAQRDLDALREQIGDCTLCRLHKGRRNLVFGAGNANADLMFIGEAPGRDEDMQGEPFVGRAGQLLNRIIEAMGLKRTDVYIANINKCRPPNNRAPARDEADACLPFLHEQVAIIKPKVIVCLGSVAVQNLLRTEEKISRIRGQWREFDGIPVMPTYHPAFLLRNPAGKRPVWEDMQEVMKKLK
jgi:uracil-DNA glycosylase family 4